MSDNAGDEPRDPRLRGRVNGRGTKRTESNGDTGAGVEIDVDGGTASLAPRSNVPWPSGAGNQNGRRPTEAPLSRGSDLASRNEKLQADYQKVTAENVKLARGKASEAKAHMETHARLKNATESHSSMTQSHAKRLKEKHDMVAERSGLLEEIAGLKEEKAGMESKLAVMTDQSEKVQTMESRIAQLEMQVTQLESKRTQLATENNGLRTRNTRLVQEKEQLLAPMRAIDQPGMEHRGERRDNDRDYSRYRSSSPRRAYDTFPGRQPPRGPRGGGNFDRSFDRNFN